MKHAFITWVDSCKKSGWLEEHEATSVTEIISIGLVVKETDGEIVISTSYSEQHKQWMDPLTIPKMSILTIKIEDLTSPANQES